MDIPRLALDKDGVTDDLFLFRLSESQGTHKGEDSAGVEFLISWRPRAHKHKYLATPLSHFNKFLCLSRCSLYH